MTDRLYRSREDRMLAGVAGGLAEMWDADPSLVRIIWALLVIFTGGIALLVYIVMAIVVPEADDVFPVSQPVATDMPEAAGEADAADIQATTSAQSAREARAQARAARRAARTERGGTPAAIIVGGFLVLLGAFFLLRQILPSFDFDWFWPLALVGLGAVLIVTAIGRGPRSGDTP